MAVGRCSICAVFVQVDMTEVKKRVIVEGVDEEGYVQLISDHFKLQLFNVRQNS